MRRNKTFYVYLHKSPSYNAIIKYGWDNIEHYIVVSGLPEDMAKKLEIHLISFFKACNRSYNPSKETRRKLGDSKRGKPISEEQKLKISKALKGRKVHPNTIKAIIRTHTAYGYKWKWKYDL